MSQQNFLQRMLQRSGLQRPPSAATPAQDETSVAHVFRTAAGDSGAGTQFTKIYSGTVGHIDASKTFHVHPDYHQIAYLFSLTGPRKLQSAVTHDAPAAGDPDEVSVSKAEETLEIRLPASAMKAFRANMIRASAARWGDLYKAIAGQFPASAVGLAGAALAEDERRTTENVARYVESSGLKPFDVPVLYDAGVDEEDPGMRGATETEVLAIASKPRQITLMPMEWASDAGHQRQETAITHEMAAEVQDIAAGALPGQWIEHKGPLDLKVEGTLSVLAMNKEQAHTVASALILLADAEPELIGNYLKPKATSIQGAELLAPTPPENDLGDRYDRYDRGFY